MTPSIQSIRIQPCQPPCGFGCEGATGLGLPRAGRVRNVRSEERRCQASFLLGVSGQARRRIRLTPGPQGATACQGRAPDKFAKPRLSNLFPHPRCSLSERSSSQ